MKSVAFLIFLFIAVKGYTQDFWQPIIIPDTLLINHINAEKEGIIFFSSGGNNNYSGLFRTLDYGINWEHLTLGTYLEDIYFIKYSLNGDLFVGTSGGIYRSHDNGDYFEKVYTPNIGMLHMANSPDSSIYITCTGEILRSEDQGNTWHCIYHNGIYSLYIYDIDFGPSGEIYSIAYDFSGNLTGLHRSFDNGILWDFIPIDNSNQNIEVNKFGEIIITGNTQPFWYSADRGTTWEPRGSVYSVCLESDSDDILFSGTYFFPKHYWGCGYSNDWAKTWNILDSTLLDTYVQSISISDDKFVYLECLRRLNDSAQLLRSKYPLLNYQNPEHKTLFNVSPNPAVDKISVNYIPEKAENYFIYDINGKAVISGELNSQEIDVSKLNPGIYIFRSNYLGKFQSCKFIIQ